MSFSSTEKFKFVSIQKAIFVKLRHEIAVV